MAKDWYKSKTVWINLGLFLAAAMDLLIAQGTLIPASWLPYVIMGQSLIGLALRMITGQPIAGTPADTGKPQSTGGGSPE